MKEEERLPFLMRTRTRPVARLPRSLLETLLVGLTVLGVIILLAETAWNFATFPAIFPSSAQGSLAEVPYHLTSAFFALGHKGILLLAPALCVCLVVLQAFVTRLPHRSPFSWPMTAENVSRRDILARLLLHCILLEIVGMAGVLQWFWLQAARSCQIGSILLMITGQCTQTYNQATAASQVVLLATGGTIIVTILLYLSTKVPIR